MHELTIDGTRYVKAVDIAKDLGYTSDYVGQLCRSGKVDAQQVGRAWYVVPESLRDHKQDRYRTNVEKSKQAVRAYKEAVADDAPAQRSTRHVPVTHYERDEADLWPQPKAREKADETKTADVPVSSEEHTHTYGPAEREQVAFTGELDVADGDEDTEADVSPAKTKTPDQSSEKNGQSIAMTIVDAPTTPRRRTTTMPVHHTDADNSGTVGIRSQATKQNPRKGMAVRYLVITITAMFVIVFLTLTVSVQSLYEAGEMRHLVQFEPGKFIEYINLYIDISFKR